MQAREPNDEIISIRRKDFRVDISPYDMWSPIDILIT